MAVRAVAEVSGCFAVEVCQNGVTFLQLLLFTSMRREILGLLSKHVPGFTIKNNFSAYNGGASVYRCHEAQECLLCCVST